MTERSYNKLVELLCCNMSIDLMQSMMSFGGNKPITPSMVVAAGLRFLERFPYKDVADVLGISWELVKCVIIRKSLDIVNNSKDLAISLPNSPTELQKCAGDWSKLSSAFGIYNGVIGAMDGGWLACSDKPNISNPADYYTMVITSGMD